MPTQFVIKRISIGSWHKGTTPYGEKELGYDAPDGWKVRKVWMETPYEWFVMLVPMGQ